MYNFLMKLLKARNSALIISKLFVVAYFHINFLFTFVSMQESISYVFSVSWYLLNFKFSDNNATKRKLWVKNSSRKMKIRIKRITSGAKIKRRKVKFDRKWLKNIFYRKA